MLHSHTYGSGHDVWLALHGWGGSHLTFAPLEPQLPEGVRLIAVDMPGYGRSPAVQQWSMEEYLAPLVALIDSMPEQQFSLIGNCSGAIFGLEAALRRPDRFSRLVLIDPFAWLPWYFRIFLLPFAGRLFYLTAFANPVGRVLANVALSKHRKEDVSITESFTRVDHDAALKTLRLLSTVHGASTYRQVANPVSILRGERTFAAVTQSIADWLVNWPQAPVHVVSGAGHLPILENPALVAQLAFHEGSS
jgi:pimeloyl-ACP methyl ester carboxylesterase